MNYQDCLKQIALDAEELETFTALVEENTARGIDPQTAAQMAVTQRLGELVADYREILAAVESSTGEELPKELWDKYRAILQKPAKIEATPEAESEQTPEQLGPGRESPLEGAPAEEIPGAEGERETEGVTSRGAEYDLQRDGAINSGRDERDGGLAYSETEVSVSPAGSPTVEPGASNYQITEADELGKGGAKTKYKANVEAIRLLKQLEADGRQATPEEQAVLVKYVGWGGIPQVFDPKNSKWAKEYAELKEVLTDQEYEAARRSTQDAHYTAAPVVQGMYKALKRLGFQGGHILEPAAGTGNFLGLMPPALQGKSRVTAVELDHITGGIANQLYPHFDIHYPRGFQEVSIPGDYFDAAIGNPPFGSQKVYDKNHPNLSKFSIHNYFFAKSLEKVRPGGVVAMVVSNYLMDAHNSTARAHLAEKSRLLGAIRLPNNAFKANAGTEVTTDIIFLQRLSEGESADTSWVNVETYTNEDGESMPLNAYFVQNPDMMLGDLRREGTQYAPDTPALIAREGADLSKDLARAIENLPENVYKTRKKAIEEVTDPNIVVSDPDSIKVYGYGLDDQGNIVTRLPDEMDQAQFAKAEATGKVAERIKGLINLRGVLRGLMRAELQNAEQSELDAKRKELNAAYQKFQKKYGYINARANKLAFRDDPDYPLLASLEVDFDPGITPATAKKQGVLPRKPSAKLADIFTKRVLKPYYPPATADSPADALTISLAEIGSVDFERMTALTGLSETDLQKELIGLIYEDPEAGWVTADEYLSGNVKHKLRVAKQRAEQDPDTWQVNVEALENVQPADVEAVDIDVRLGSPWVPASDIQQFIKDLIGASSRVKYEPSIGKWFANISRQSANTTDNTSTWGTERKPASDIIGPILSGKSIAVYDRGPEGERILNQEETTAATSKAEEIKREFKDWIWRDEERRVRLHRYYNDVYNTNRQREYDGSHLILPGKSPAVSLRPSQLNAIWRGIQDGRVLLDHVVGAGKTYTMIGTAMERRRMGLSNKPMIAVPNHLVGQWASDFLTLYPGAKVLATTKKDFEKGNRQKLFSKIATGDWDAVIVAHSSSEKIPMPQEEEVAFIDTQVKDVANAIETARLEEGKASLSVKQMEKQKDRLESKLEAAKGAKKKDDVVDFAELGVDELYVDEAHEFKNLFFATSMTRVAGLGDPNGSQKAFDLFVKSQYIQRLNNGRGLFFATGTPISNTVAEMFTMQRYMQYQELKERGLHHFDGWANTFGNIVSAWELDSTGVNYKMNNRFAQFVNVPELLQLYQSFADVITQSDLEEQAKKQGMRWPIPKLKDGQVSNVVVARSGDQAAYMDEIIHRAQNMPKDPRQDNFLKVTNDARKMALDMRLIDPEASDFKDSKIHAAADRIKAKYDQWQKDKGTQLVFIDLSTPKTNKGKASLRAKELMVAAQKGDEQAAAELEKIPMDELLADQSDFSVYDDLKQKLIQRGIPEKEIKFIHEANTELQKEKLFDQVRRGEIRVLFGSTAKMGAGMNVQNRLVALHHLDAPWRPSDIEQREGRILRQGNELYMRDPDNFEIEISRYATERTYDARMWQVLEGKARFIGQLRKGNTGQRVVEDVGSQAASFADLKAAATGNPLILEQVKLDAEVRRLESLAISYKRGKHRLQDTINRLADHDERASAEIANIEADIARRDSVPIDKKNFSITLQEKAYTDRTKAAKQIVSRLAGFLKDSRPGAEMALGEFRTFPLKAVRTMEGIGLVMTGEGGKYSSYYGKGDSLSESGVITRLVNALDRMEENLDLRKKRRDKDEETLQTAKREVNQPFPQQEELDTKSQQFRWVMAELDRLNDPTYEPMSVEDVLAGKQPPPKPEPAASLVEGESSGMRGDVAKEFVQNLTRDWKNKPKIHVYGSPAEVPPRLQAFFKSLEKRGKKPTATIRGSIDSKGGIHVYAFNIPNTEVLQKVVFHEALGHLGLRSFFGEELDPLLMQVYRSILGTKEHGQLIRAYKNIDVSTESGKKRLAEEYLAMMAERNVKPKLWEKFLAFVKKWLRKAGWRMNLSNSELKTIVAAAARHIREGTVESSLVYGDSAANQTGPVFYSKMLEQLEKLLPESGGSEQLAMNLRAYIRKGYFKQEEADWIGIFEWLKEQEGKVTKQQILDFIAAHEVVVEDVVLSESGQREDVTDGGMSMLEFIQRDEMPKWADSAALEMTDADAKELFGLNNQQIKEMRQWQRENEQSMEQTGEPAPIVPIREHRYIDTPLGRYDIRREQDEQYYTLFFESAYGAVESFEQGQFPQAHLAEFYAHAHYEENKSIATRRTEYGYVVEPGGSDYTELLLTLPQGTAGAYSAPHFRGVQNIAAHVRFNSRTNTDGESVLFIEEVQSDWHQKGRKKGYRKNTTRWGALQEKGYTTEKEGDIWVVYDEAGDPVSEGGTQQAAIDDIVQRDTENVTPDGAVYEGGVPDTPFKTTWPMLVMKRMIRYAAEHGFDRIAWTTGEQQAIRNQQIRYADNIQWVRLNSGKYSVIAYGDGYEKTRSETGLDDKQLAELVGEEPAEQIINSESESGDINLDAPVPVGGAGNKAFYDRILPNMVGKYVKKWGAKVDQTEIPRPPSILKEMAAGPTGTAESATMTTHSVKITDKMIDAAIGGQPMFSIKRHHESGDENLDKLLSVIGKPDKSMTDRFRDFFGTRFNDRMTQSILDQFHGLKMYDEESYMAARMSTSTHTQLFVALTKGPLKWLDGRAVIDRTQKGLLEILEPASKVIHLWEAYMAAKRGMRLYKEGREKLMTPDMIVSGLAQAYTRESVIKMTMDNADLLAAAQELPQAEPQYAYFRDIATEWAKYNRTMIDFAQEAGLIDAEQRKLWENDDYVPFYRILSEQSDEGPFNKPFSKKGLSGQSAGVWRLHGGVEQLNDILENMIMNTSHLIEASMKNHALRMAVDNLDGTGLMEKSAFEFKPELIPEGQIKKDIAQRLGIPVNMLDMVLPLGDFKGFAKMYAMHAPTNENVVRVMVDGKPQYYQVYDPLLLRSLTSINQKAWGNWMKVFTRPKRWLTALVTADPAFQIANYMRDTMQSFVISRDRVTPILSGLQGAKKTLGKSEIYWDMLAAGGGFHSGYINQGDPDAASRIIKAEMRHKGFASTVLNTPQKIWDAWQEFGSAIENANRMAIYEAAVKSGKSELEAAFEAKDFMDFSLRGDGPIYMFLASTVPFLNARVQGLYRLGRGAHQHPVSFAINGSLIMLASFLLYYINMDDDRYKELAEWDKDTYWHFWIGEKHFRLPKPFEVGVLFATFPERLAEAIYSDEDDAAKRLFDRFIWNIWEVFNIGQMPQTVAPIVEQVANRSFFTDRPIEGLGMQRLEPEARYSSYTHETSIQLGRALGLSPARIDHLLRAYTGTIGDYALSTTDMLIKGLWDFPVTPDLRWDDVPVVKRFYRDTPPRGTRYSTEFYDLYRELDQVYNTVRTYKMMGDEDRAKDLLEENRERLRILPALRRMKRTLGKINTEMRRIHQSRTISPEMKRKRIDELIQRKNEAYKAAMDKYREMSKE